jgi:hypothetical protein
MTSSLSNTFNSEQYLEIGYGVGKFLQSLTTDNDDTSGVEEEKPYNSSPWDFFDGPACRFYSSGITKKGIVIDSEGGRPSLLHTPFGCWHVLGCGYESGENQNKKWGKTCEIAKEALGLVYLQEDSLPKRVTQFKSGPFWAVTKFNGQVLGMPEYGIEKEHLSISAVHDAWNSFIPMHKDLVERKKANDQYYRSLELNYFSDLD